MNERAKPRDVWGQKLARRLALMIPLFVLGRSWIREEGLLYWIGMLCYGVTAVLIFQLIWLRIKMPSSKPR